MSRIAHIRNNGNSWELVKFFTLENGVAKGNITNADGKTIQIGVPAVGWTSGDGIEKIVSVTENTDDTSTGSNTVTTKNQTIAQDGVIISTVIRDKTSQELDTEVSQKAIDHSKQLSGKLHKMSLAGIYWITNDVRNRAGQQPITVDTFLTQLDTFASKFDDAKFVTKMKEILNG